MNTKEYAAYVALDWGDKQHAFALQLGANEIEAGQFEASAEALHGWLDALNERLQGGPVALAIEAGRNVLLHALLEHSWLDIYPVHPATSARFRRAFTPSGAKSDVPDAQVLLTLLSRHRDQLVRLELEGAATRRLAALVAARRSAVDCRTRLSNQLRSVLKSYFPQALELIGCELTTPMALDFLARWPELGLVQKVRAQSLQAFYCRHNVRRADAIEQRIQRIRAARALILDRALIEPAVLQVQMLVGLLRLQNTHIKGFESEIDRAFVAHPEAKLFQQLPGAGPTLAPRLLAAFGERRERYPEAASLQKYAGIAPVRQQSGRHVWIHWRWSAPAFLRQSFVEWAGQTVVFCPWAAAFYRHHRKAGKTHQVILRALAFKWIRILWRCWQDRQPYDDARYLAALKRRGSPLIAELPAS